MKKVLIVILAFAFSLSLVGCQALTTDKEPNDKGTEINTNTTSNIPQGITVNTISFKHLSLDELSTSISDNIEKNKEKKGYEYFLAEDGTFTLIVYAGEKSTGGYGIEVVSVEDNEGHANVIVEETKPKADEMVKQQVTYPFDVVRFTGTTDNFSVVNPKGDPYQPIENE